VNEHTLRAVVQGALRDGKDNLRGGEKPKELKNEWKDCLDDVIKISDTLSTSLGPLGAEKILTDGKHVAVSNFAATILRKVRVTHPVAQLLIEMCESIDKELGEGSKTMVVLTGELVKGAKELLDQGFHPLTIAHSYIEASRKAVEFLDSIAVNEDPLDRGTLLRVIKTAMSQRLDDEDGDYFADIIAESLLGVVDQASAKYDVDLSNIKVLCLEGGAARDTQLVHGVVVEQPVVNGFMPKRIENARILLLSAKAPPEPEKFPNDDFINRIEIDDPKKMEEFRKEYDALLWRMVNKIESIGCNVLFHEMLGTHSIHERVQAYLGKRGILAARFVDEEDMKRLGRATGAKRVTAFWHMSEEDLGYAKIVEEREVFKPELTDPRIRWIFVDGCRDPRAMTLVVKGLKTSAANTKRTVEHALRSGSAFLRDPRIVYGGGAVEAVLSFRLKEWARGMEDRRQMAVMKFAEALLAIPLLLAKNCGMNSLDTMIALNNRYASGENWYGIDCLRRGLRNMEASSVREPLIIKRRVYESAAAAAMVMLRIDRMLKRKESRDREIPESVTKTEGYKQTVGKK